MVKTLAVFVIQWMYAKDRIQSHRNYVFPVMQNMTLIMHFHRFPLRQLIRQTPENKPREKGRHLQAATHIDHQREADELNCLW